MYSSFDPSLTTNNVQIDNYQGEESDIVIASQTRLNDTNETGFMNSPERLDVLISRARDGFVLIGNSATFMNARKGRELRGKFFQLIRQWATCIRDSR